MKSFIKSYLKRAEKREKNKIIGNTTPLFPILKQNRINGNTIKFFGSCQSPLKKKFID